MKASFLDLRKNGKDILRALERNESITLLYRGKEIAVISPIKGKNPKMRVQDHEAFGMWANREDMKDVDAYVRRLRKGRDFGI